MDWLNIIQNVQSNIIILDETICVVAVTNQFLETTFKTKDVIGKSLFDEFPEQLSSKEAVKPKIEQNIKTCIKDKIQIPFGPYQYNILDNTTGLYEKRYWKYIATPVLLKDGSFSCCILQVEDVTDTTNLTAMLHDARTFKLLVNNIKDYAIFLMDVEGIIKTWNEGARKLKLYEADEIIGKHFSIFYTPEDLNNGKPKYQLENAIKYGRIEDESWRIKKDGSKFWANVVITPVYNDINEHVGFVKVTRDLTERKKNEERIISAYEESSKLKSEFLTNMSHEIRTPMNGVIGASNLLQKTQLTEEQKEYVQILTESSDILIKLIDDILDYSTIESNELNLVINNFSITNEIRKVENNFKIIPTNVDIIVNICDIPIVQGDAYRFRQIITNLVDNAIKFTNKGTVIISASYKTLPSNSSTNHIEKQIQLTLTVEDTGIGMTQDEISKLFSPFTQLEAFAKKRFRGAGLGLCICKQLVDLMNGQIYVESEKNKGTKFTIVIPFKIGRPENKTQEAIISTNNLEPKNKNILILIVEDNKINQNLIIKILKSLGYWNFELAINGQEAVDFFKVKSCDIILMDIQMPVMDGFEATKIIREMNSSIPIIAMTANALKGDADKCLAAGMTDYLSKPINFVTLCKIINKHS